MTVRCTGFMNAMLTCEELFLLLTKDSGNPESRMTYPAYGLTGALLTDLLLAGRISLTAVSYTHLTLPTICSV